MSIRNKLGSQIDRLFQEGAWEDARVLLEREREREPENHWLLTQLGVTFYEQEKYEEAKQLFLAAGRIMPECPLVLWNLAGTLDALGLHREGMAVYTWLLQTKISPDEDPCWESEEWADALKADCVYRLGLCFEHLSKKQKALHWYRRYLDLLLVGVEGTYSAEQVTNRIRKLDQSGAHQRAKSQFRELVTSTLKDSWPASTGRKRGGPQTLDVEGLLAGRHVASKK